MIVQRAMLNLMIGITLSLESHPHYVLIICNISNGNIIIKDLNRQGNLNIILIFIELIIPVIFPADHIARRHGKFRTGLILR